MKLRREHVRNFRNQIAELQQDLPGLLRECDEWIRHHDQYERYGSMDQASASDSKYRLESRLRKFRNRLGQMYDFMSERGLRDLEATNNNVRTKRR